MKDERSICRCLIRPVEKTNHLNEQKVRSFSLLHLAASMIDFPLQGELMSTESHEHQICDGIVSISTHPMNKDVVNRP